MLGGVSMNMSDIKCIVCPQCEGKGFHLMEDDDLYMHHVICSMCDGSGKVYGTEIKK